MSYISTAVRSARVTAIALAAAGALLASASAAEAAKPTVVLVHGAWADGSSWASVAGRLQSAGYTVDVPPNPLRGLASDTASIAAFLKTVKGPVVLAGHSYGGAVITDAATGNPAIKALVYVDAYIPDAGETVAGLTGAKPGSLLGVKDPTTVFDFAPYPGAPAGDVDLYVKPSVFPAAFAADESRHDAAVRAASQRPLTLGALMGQSTAPAWKTIPSWAVIGTADKVIPPAEQVVMTGRAHAKTTKIKAAHLSMVSQPAAVTKVIMKAIEAASR
jgi:pimeloyl-ACP methyl ester carboxylesterase